MKLFILTNNSFTLNNPEVLLINEFMYLWQRDETIGKVKALTEFKFIYHICDPQSVPNKKGYNEKEALMFAIKECNLPPNYKPDKYILAALNRYVEIRSSVIAEVCQELLISFKSSSSVLKKIRNRIDTLLKQEVISTAELSEIRTLQQEIISMASSIPEHIKKIVKAQAELDAEETGELARGKIVISDSMNPDTAIG